MYSQINSIKYKSQIVALNQEMPNASLPVVYIVQKLTKFEHMHNTMAINYEWNVTHVSTNDDYIV